MASSILSRDRIKYTDYLGPSQQGENCFLNQPVLYKPWSKGSAKKKLLKALEKTATQHGITEFSMEQIKQIALSINVPTEKFSETMESLNMAGYLIKKGPNKYKLLLS